MPSFQGRENGTFCIWARKTAWFLSHTLACRPEGGSAAATREREDPGWPGSPSPQDQPQGLSMWGSRAGRLGHLPQSPPALHYVCQFTQAVVTASDWCVTLSSLWPKKYLTRSRLWKNASICLTGREGAVCPSRECDCRGNSDCGRRSRGAGHREPATRPGEMLSSSEHFGLLQRTTVPQAAHNNCLSL